MLKIQVYEKAYLFFFQIIVCTNVIAQWNFVGQAGISDNWTVDNNIAIDASGSPVIVYYDNLNHKAACLKFDGTNWMQAGSTSFMNFPIESVLDFKIDRKNNYYILFRNSTSTDYFKTSCLRFDGSTWKYVGSRLVSTEMLQSHSLAIDTAGVVYIAFYGQSGFKVVKDKNGTWEPVSTKGIESAIDYLNLEFDENNIAYIGYSSTFLNKVNCAKFIDGSWLPVGNGNIPAGLNFVQYTKLLITKNHDIYLGFDFEGINCYKLDVPSNTWKRVGVEGLDGGHTGISDLKSDQNSKIYITTSHIAGDKARCLSFNGTKWEELGTLGISESYAGTVKMAFNNYSKLFVTYNDWNLSKAVVKSYILPTGMFEVNNDNHISIFPNPASDNFKVECIGQKFKVEIYDLKGNQLYEAKDVFNSIVIQSKSFTRGVYIVKVIGQNKIINHRKIIVYK